MDFSQEPLVMMRFADFTARLQFRNGQAHTAGASMQRKRLATASP
jgi:hypothetical protein